MKSAAARDSEQRKAPTILAFGAGTWRWPQVFGSPRYHLWSLAARGWRVVYTEPPTAWRFTAKSWSAPDRDFHVLSPARVVPFRVRAIPDESLGNYWRRVTSWALAREAKTFMQRRAWSPDFIWCGAPWHSSLAAHFPNTASLFHIYDELSLSPALGLSRQKILWTWEQELLAGARLALCSSLPQLNRRKPLCREAMLLENAIPDSFLGAAESSPEADALLARLRELPAPRAVYGGVVDLRVDPVLVQGLLNDDRLGSVVFLGKIDDNADESLQSMIRTHPRAHAFGSIPHDAYPALYEAADLLFLLHNRNDFTDAMYPEKLNEYLASGRPILSVPLPEVLRVSAQCEGEGAVRFASNIAQLDEAVAACLADDDDHLGGQRIALARRHTWDREGEKLDAVLREIVHQTGAN